MSEDRITTGISFNNMRINSIASNSGVFAGYNVQYLWDSKNSLQLGFGDVIGEYNIMEDSCNVVTDSGSSSELLEYFKGQIEKKLGGRDI